MLMLRNPVFWFGMSFILGALLARAYAKYEFGCIAYQRSKPEPSACDIGSHYDKQGFWLLVALVSGVFGIFAVITAHVSH